MITSSNQEFPRMRTIRAAAAESGLAEFHLRRLVSENKIVFVKTGRKILVNMGSLASYLNGEGAQM